MAFMEPEIFKGCAVLLDGSDGITVLPFEDLSQAEREAVDRCIAAQANEDEDAWEDAADLLRCYYDGREMQSVALAGAERGKRVWLYRLNAPGYLDCTPWSYAETREEAEERLREDYGVGEDEDDEADDEA